MNRKWAKAAMVRRDASRRRVLFAAATHREERPFCGDQRREVVGLPSMVVPSGLTHARAKAEGL